MIYSVSFVKLVLILREARSNAFQLSTIVLRTESLFECGIVFFLSGAILFVLLQAVNIPSILFRKSSVNGLKLKQ